MKKPQINEASSLAVLGEMQYSCSCLHHGPILTQNISVNASRNTLSVAEAVHESSARNSEIVPGHSKQPSWRLRINPKIKTGCGQAESSLVMKSVSLPKILPLRKIARFVQGIALFKEREV